MLLPASGLLLALTNIVTLKAAWKELRSKRLGVSVLYVTIVVATIVSGASLRLRDGLVCAVLGSSFAS